MKSNGNSKFKMSLNAQFLLNSILVILLLGGVSLYQIDRAIEMQKGHALQQFKLFAHNIAHAIPAQFYERYFDVQAFAKNAIVHTKNEQEMSKLFDQLVELYGLYDVILVVDKSGRFVASNTVNASGEKINIDNLRKINYSESPWFKNVMNGKFTEDKTNNFSQTYVEDALIDPVSVAALGTKRLGSSFSTVLYNERGEFSGVITNRANFSWVEAELTKSFETLQDHSLHSAEITVINKEGFVIAELDPAANGGDVNVKQNLDVLLKENLVENGLQAAKDLTQGKAGSGFEMHSRKKINQAVGYEFLDDSKWIPALGWGVLVRDNPEELMGGLSDIRRNIFLSIGIISIFVFVGVLLLGRKISNSFIAVSEKLQSVAEATSKTSQNLSDAAQAVASATSEQAAAVQESVSSMSEITSMIAQTGQNVKECSDISQKVASRTEDGSRIMERMVSSMESIHQANAQLQNMANIINEVSNRTMVINDIVFKTQLLSINASIEAGRAGQHGKGFSVVAEEVGNLAQMSGNAAKEIQTLIQDSQRQVAQIIETTQHRVNEGQQVSKEALATFNEIATGIQGMSERIIGIGQATREQDLGIKQISIAMNEMDMTTQRNSVVSAKTSELSRILSEHGYQVNRVMQAMKTLVRGNLNGFFQVKNKVDIIDSIVGTDARSHNMSELKLSDEEFRNREGGQTNHLSTEKSQENFNGSIDRLAKRRITMKPQSFESIQGPRSVPSDLDANDDSFNSKVS